MSILTIILTIIYCLIAIGLIGVVLLQDSKSAGLGSISGAAESYWGKNKSRSMEGTFERFTEVGAGLFIILALVLSFLIK